MVTAEAVTCAVPQEPGLDGPGNQLTALCLESLNNFCTRSSDFHFALDPQIVHMVLGQFPRPPA